MFPRTLFIGAQNTLAILNKNSSKIEDFVATKLFKITGTATKKDFVDLYFLANKCFSIEKMFNFYDKKYHNFEINKIILLKALQYFEDADESEMPMMIEKINWEEVKDFFKKEVVKLADKYL